MRWTDENIAKFNRVLCETQNLVINVEAISRNWPVDPASDEQPPTAKAIADFLGKYKKTLKPGASLTCTHARDADGAASTPRKRKATAGTKSAKKTKVSKAPVEDDEA